MKRSLFPVLALVGLAALLPGQAMAQTMSCNADISVATGPGAEFFMNEPIPMVVNVGAGEVLDPGIDGGLGYLDLDYFEYKLDCDSEETFATCTDGGNTVDFVESSVATNCTDSNGDPITFVFDEPNDTDELIVFTPDSGLPIRNDSDTTCEVTFDVIVTEIAPENQLQEVVEMTGWVNTGGEGNIGVCSNDLVAAQTASVSFNFLTTTLFRVSKVFSDDNPAPVDVHISCNAGLPLEQDFTITKDSVVTFTSRYYQPGELNCRVWEEPVPDNYTDSYLAGTVTGVGDYSEDEDGCYFNNVSSGMFTCEVTNAADPGGFTVNKEWLFGESEGEEIELVAGVTIFCDKEILEDDAVFDVDEWYVMRELLGETDSVTIAVDTADGPAMCSALEDQAMSGVEVTNGCASPMEVVAGAQASCTITNTFFFEGIPTLGQYGMALLVLLTLGVGMVGFRRYA